MAQLPLKIMRNPDCIFCQIADGKIPAQSIFDDGELMAFPDIHPQAPVHILIIPKDHAMRSIAEMADGQEMLVGRMIVLAKKLAEEQGIADNGYRLVFNVRHHAGQEVDHLHLHILGGKKLGPVA